MPLSLNSTHKAHNILDTSVLKIHKFINRYSVVKWRQNPARIPFGNAKDAFIHSCPHGLEATPQRNVSIETSEDTSVKYW